MKKLLILLFVALASGAASAQTGRSQTGRPQARVSRHYQLGGGPVNILDTYLSQEKFSGQGITLLSTSLRERESSPWATLVQSQVRLATAEDRDGNESVVEGVYNFYIGRYYSLLTAERLVLRAGALATAGLGVIYDTRNSNNPAQARASLLLMPSAIATYGFTILHRPTTLRWQTDVPLAGLAFSPNYGQSYYEMFTLGNYDHNVVPTTFVSQPTFRQQISIAYRLWPRLSLSIGYLGDYQQLRVNNLKQHVYSHSILLGIQTSP